jgi:integrase
MRPTPRTFPTKTSAEQWLTRTEADILSGDWLDPDAGLIPFADYAAAWIDERDLRPGTAQVYRYVLGRHINPTLGRRAVVEIKEPHVRKWRKALLDSGVNTASVAKAYRLLKVILNTAVDDELIRRNPCRIKGAAQDRSPERSILTTRQVFALADAVDPCYRALILLAVFASLRWGELAALRRADVDLETGTAKIARSLNELPGGGFRLGLPKTQAGAPHRCTRCALSRPAPHRQ